MTLIPRVPVVHALYNRIASFATVLHQVCILQLGYDPASPDCMFSNANPAVPFVLCPSMSASTMSKKPYDENSQAPLCGSKGITNQREWRYRYPTPAGVDKHPCIRQTLPENLPRLNRAAVSKHEALLLTTLSLQVPNVGTPNDLSDSRHLRLPSNTVLESPAVGLGNTPRVTDG